MANIFNQKLMAKFFIWLMAEIILNLIGIDDLADYSEFIFEHKLQIAQVIVVPKTLIKITNHQLYMPMITKIISKKLILLTDSVSKSLRYFFYLRSFCTLNNNFCNQN